MAKQEALHVRYRPDTFVDVVGNKSEVRALQEVIKDEEAQCFLLTGPSGIGKTTLARIAAAEVGCLDAGLLEVNAANYTGVDDMRRIQDAIQTKPFGSPIRAIVVDECHRLSANAWDSLLKATEEPPEWVYWFFCTTNAAKVPETIRTRCISVNLQALTEAGLLTVLERVIDAEDIKLPAKVPEMIAFEARGSARLALNYLAKVKNAKDYKSAAEALKAVASKEPAIALCRFLTQRNKRTWVQAVKLLAAVEENPESIRILVCNYVASALGSTKTDGEACYFLSILDAFSTTYNSSEGKAPLYCSVGRVIYGGDQ